MKVYKCWDNFVLWPNESISCNVSNMRKLLLAVVMFFLFAGVSYAADSKGQIALPKGISLKAACGMKRFRGWDKQMIQTVTNLCDSIRKTDVDTIMNLVFQYLIDMNKLPTGIPQGLKREICQSTVKMCPARYVDLRFVLGHYADSFPIDPSLSKGAVGTGYFVKKDAKGSITIKAQHAQSSKISVTR